MDSRRGCLPHTDNICFYEVQRIPLFEEASNLAHRKQKPGFETRPISG
jgi:hypothetical protein